MNYLIDTNACLDFLLRRNDRVTERVGAAFGRLVVSAITVAELRMGARQSADPDGDDRIIDLFVAGVTVAPFDDSAAEAYGAMVRQVGMRRGSFDRQIAAHALALKLPLVTNNVRDFAGIPGLAVENWAA